MLAKGLQSAYQVPGPIGSIETVNEGDVIHEVGTCCSLCRCRLRRRGVLGSAGQRSESLEDVQ
jgi:UDP-N-acetylenolpyruvoylglucosamine reductase